MKEIEFAPKNVKEKLANISRNKIEYLDIYDEALFLRNQYLENGILSEKRIDDATHVALATIYRADAIV